MNKFSPIDVMTEKFSQNGGKPIPIEGVMYYSETFLRENKKLHHEALEQIAIGQKRVRVPKKHVELAAKAKYEEISRDDLLDVLNCYCRKLVQQLIYNVEKGRVTRFVIVEVDGKKCIAPAKQADNVAREKVYHDTLFRDVNRLWEKCVGDGSLAGKLAKALHGIWVGDKKKFRQKCSDYGGPLPGPYRLSLRYAYKHECRLKLEEMGYPQATPSDLIASEQLLLAIQKRPHEVKALLDAGKITGETGRGQLSVDRRLCVGHSSTGFVRHVRLAADSRSSSRHGLPAPAFHRARPVPVGPPSALLVLPVNDLVVSGPDCGSATIQRFVYGLDNRGHGP